MVTVVLISALLMASTPVWGETGQMCLSCHPVHHREHGGCPDCHRGNPKSDRKTIAHAGFISGKYALFNLPDSPQLKNGRRLTDRYACRRCHVTDGRGNRLAVTLDDAAARKTPEELADSIRRPVDSMPDFRLNEEQSTFLVNAILAGAKKRSSDDGAPVTVHFNIDGKKDGDAFTRLCGSCHRLLSEKRGALGTGNIGPNLSGLLSPFYPKTFRNSEKWTFYNLKSWLKNPRKSQPWAKMRPITPTVEDAQEIESILPVSPYVKR